MKPAPAEQRIVDRMAPGALCRDGFLGGDGRPLGEILATDRAAVERLGLTHERIAQRLQEILRAAIAGLGTAVAVGEHLTAQCGESMGRLACPWGGCGVFAKGEVELRDADGRTVRFTPLSVHLIARHGFYQGRGSRYRLEPAGLAAMLDLGLENGPPA